MTYINSNLTNREAYALHGKLDNARMQALLDLEDSRMTAEIQSEIDTAANAYPLEGFMQHLIDDIAFERITNLATIHEQLIEIQMSVLQEANVGATALSDLEDLLR